MSVRGENMAGNKHSEKSGSRMKKNLSRLLTMGCIAVFIYAGHGLYSIFMEYYKNRQALADVQQIYYQFDEEVPIEVASTEDMSEQQIIRPQFTELQEINQDIVGWVSIEGTPLDYPILQSDDNDYYLNRNYKKEYSIAGSIFMDYRNDASLNTQNTIIYGHRMKDNSMFNSLKNFLDKDFFDSHKIVKFDTLYESYDAEVFAVYNTTTDFDYIQTDFTTDEEFESLLNEIHEKSKYHTNVELTADDQIITLSTCDYILDPNKGRLVVHAKIVKKSDSTNYASAEQR